jgi:hypothetical protein
MDKIPMRPLVSRPVAPRPAIRSIPPLPRSLLQLIIKRANAVEPVVSAAVSICNT